jgi:hypothetical protein
VNPARGAGLRGSDWTIVEFCEFVTVARKLAECIIVNKEVKPPRHRVLTNCGGNYFFQEFLAAFPRRQ